jgi:hypothetical protein
MKKILLFLIILAAFQIISGQVNDFEKALYNLRNVRFEKITTPKGYESAYKLYIRQPVDHFHPEKGFFYQKAYLSNIGIDKPMVIITEGYDQKFNYIFELTRLVNANQILVEHRYFGESIPDSVDFTYLKAAQEAADLHEITLLLKEIYKSRWISTGVSKGGQNSIFYRYFYPDDVSVTVPYVAPVNLSLQDERIFTFLDTIGTKECRDKIKNFQIRMLKNEQKVLPFLKWYSLGKELSFTYLSLSQSYEYAVLEYSFSFWQWGHNCSEIPSDTSSLEKAIEHMLSVSDVDFFADSNMNNFKSHYYQSAAELGYYGYKTDAFKTYLKALPKKTYPSAIFTPGKMFVTYDPTLSKKVYEWATTKADHMIYIYGGNDTWSATRIPQSPNPDALWFILKGESHATARIKNMTPAEKEKLVAFLEKWLDFEIRNDTAK